MCHKKGVQTNWEILNYIGWEIFLPQYFEDEKNVKSVLLLWNIISWNTAKEIVCKFVNILQRNKFSTHFFQFNSAMS